MENLACARARVRSNYPSRETRGNYEMETVFSVRFYNNTTKAHRQVFPLILCKYFPAVMAVGEKYAETSFRFAEVVILDVEE